MSGPCSEWPVSGPSREWPATASGIRRVLAAVAALAALAACGSTARARPSGSAAIAPASTTPTTAQAATARAPLHWSGCSSGQGPAGFECATLEVPLDEAHPGRASIGLAVDRHRATGTRVGSLLVNPGGPGVSGVDFLPGIVGELPPSVLAHFDVVGFDPRGVARSAPVTCGTGRQLDAELSVDPAPTSASGFAAMVALDRRFAAGCEARSGRLLPDVGTLDAARDLDRIRAALGDARLTYLGFSYGTLLGAEYAELFPTRVRAMVLDGAIDPSLGQVAVVSAQSAALDAQLSAFLATCEAGGCGWRPAGPGRAAYLALLGRVTATPVAVAGTGRSVGPAALLYGTAAALYSPSTWRTLGGAVAALEAGNGAPMLSLFDGYIGRRADGSYANTVEAETAVNCEDAPRPSLASLQAAAPAVRRAAPVFGLLDLYSEATCAIWPVAPTRPQGPIHAVGSPPIVVVGSTGDPITPYAWARSLAAQLAHGVLVTRHGDGHTGYGYSACVRGLVDTYLLTTAPPRPDSQCAS